MAITVLDNYVEDSISLLREQFKDKPNIQTLLNIFISNIQELEYQVHDILNYSNVANAFGKTLDMVGENQGEYREGRTDEDYRARIYTRIAINNGGVDADFILNTVRKLVKPLSIHYTPLYPANGELNIRKDNFDPSLIPLIRSLPAAGVGDLVINVSSETAPLLFSEVYDMEFNFMLVDSEGEYELEIVDIDDKIYTLIGSTYSYIEPEGSEGFGEIYIEQNFIVDDEGTNILFDDGSEWLVTSPEDINTFTYDKYGGTFSETF